MKSMTKLLIITICDVFNSLDLITVFHMPMSRTKIDEYERIFSKVLPYGIIKICDIFDNDSYYQHFNSKVYLTYPMNIDFCDKKFVFYYYKKGIFIDK